VRVFRLVKRMEKRCWADENTLEWVLYGDEEEKEAAIEKFVWAADGTAIIKMMEQQDIGEDFEVVEGAATCQ
jgi:hypothetical protein